jgi:ketosteroid isomerase-like protein
MPTPDDVPEIIERYFELDAERDVEGIVALFVDDATVVDEGETRTGLDAIRGWRTGAAAEYEYTTTITGSEALGSDQYRIAARLEGDFPGGAVDLNHDFTIAGDRIRRLVIAP